MEIMFRKLKLSDDLEKVSELIYESDKYIYPTLFNDLNNCKKIMPGFIKGQTLFNYDYIYVALIKDIVVGIVVIMPKYLNDNYQNMKSILNKNNINLKNFEWVNKEYFETLNFDFKGTYITNVAVDKNYRHMGIATKMMNSLPSGTYSLAAVKDNLVAVEMYKKAGFEIIYEYPGFKEVPCVEMVRCER